MASLYKSTNPHVQAVIRVIEGQVRSFCKEHGTPLSDRDIRGITKRAAGNIVSDWARLSELRGTCPCEDSEAVS